MRSFVLRSPRQQRASSQIMRLLLEGFGRGLVRDRVLRDGRALSLTAVDVSPDLQVARVFWERADGNARERDIKAALERRKSALNLHINAYLRQRLATKLEFHHESLRTSPHDRRMHDLFDTLAAETEAWGKQCGDKRARDSTSVDDKHV
uniref:Ribosome-binding factor A n=1 Tax=Coccolithus braarudii TaxID=221442 RepID=A0A7S0Q000_9EUKA|mmetsp:Transcript_21793/g.46937  ORF Transcript_21793/g.46937 Transcript_21793/m.46937 type:complete len:150 (+) Transcript_21793:126-575(+)|eukprot:CAMPEP_0183348024 /NCGR_PEP_ID=MMETSP0164_2-20130417/12678_1 /TAXON_ID=221442 /ORGANISM="Coccolithus pelagicus ssp braarudi, Strain PLY182g" /LENGTH=149 /DNA_ID=CAMNT_0025519563 /DNA_START=118 /DNA_END=567 /DNA_ORIENTATION=-